MDPKLDGRSSLNIRYIMKLVQEKDWDWLLVADGDERIGKTTLLLHVLMVAEPGLNRAILCGEHKKVLARCAWSFDSMIDLVKNLPDGTAQLYDEASILGREAMREHNLRMVRVMSTIGIRNRLYLWTFPDFYMLDPYLRDGRVRTRAYVYTQQAERGHVVWYVRKRYPFPRPGGESVWWHKGFHATFGPIAELSKHHEEFWAKFREREQSSKLKLLEGNIPDTRREITANLRANTKLTLEEIAKIVGMSHAWTGNVLKGIPALRREPIIRTVDKKRYGSYKDR